MPGCSGGLVVTTLVCFVYFAREAAGALAPGIPRALCFLGRRFLHSSDASRRENAEARHCERSEAIHLAMPRHGLLCFARNDGWSSPSIREPDHLSPQAG